MSQEHVQTLRPSGFGWLWLGQAVTVLGDRALGVALPYVVYQQTGSLSSTALLALAGYLPGLLFGSLAGVLVDRWDRRRVLIVTQLLQGAVILLLLLAGPGRLWLATAVMFTELTLSLLALPAGAALLPTLVGEAALARAMARLLVATTTARLLGPVLGGVLAAGAGMRAVVLLDALSFVLAAALFSQLPGQLQAPRGPRPSSLISSWQAMGQEWRGGLRVIAQHRVISTLFVTLALTSLGGTLVDPYYMGFVQGVLHATPVEVGLLSTVIGAGTLLGSVAATWAVETIDLRRLVSLGTITVGGLMVGLYHQASLPPVLVLGAVLGLPMVVANVAASTLLQLGTPEGFRGRVYGALGTTNAFMGVMAAGGAALIGNRVDVVPMLTLAGALTVLAGLAALALPGQDREGGLAWPIIGGWHARARR